MKGNCNTHKDNYLQTPNSPNNDMKPCTNYLKNFEDKNKNQQPRIQQEISNLTH